MSKHEKATQVIFEYSDYVLILKGETLTNWENKINSALSEYYYRADENDEHFSFTFNNINKLEFNNVINDDKNPYRVIFIYRTYMNGLSGEEAKKYNSFINNILLDYEFHNDYNKPLLDNNTTPLRRTKFTHNLISYIDIFNLFN